MTASSGGGPAGRTRPVHWLVALDVGAATAAGVLWYLRPELGAWPLLVALAPWAVRWRLTGRPTARTAFDWPLLLFLGTAALSVWSAYDRPAAWAKWWLIVAGVLLYYAFANWGLAIRRGAGRGQVLAVALAGAGFAAYFLATNDYAAFPVKYPLLVEIGEMPQAVLPEIPGHRIHPNVAGGVAATVLPFGVAAVLLWRRRPGMLLLSAAALALILAGLLFSASRGAWLAAGGAVLVALWGAVALGLTRGDRARGRLLFMAMPVAILVAAAVWLVAQPAGLDRVLALLPPADSGLGRDDLYRGSLTLARDYPLIGVGLDGFMMAYSSYALLLHVGFTVHSHNLLLDVTIEQGVIGLAALLWMWLLVVVAVWRALGRRWTYEAPPARGDLELRRALRGKYVGLAAAAASLATIALHGMVDDALYGSRGVLLLFLPLAFAAPVLRRAGEPARQHRLAAAVAAVAVMLVVAATAGRPLAAGVRANLAAVAQSQLELSRYRWPEWGVQDELRRTLDLRPVIDQYERALALNPRHGSANRRLGQIELSLGQYEQALAHLNEAYHVAPADNATRQLLGEAYAGVDQVAEATAVWQTVESGQDRLELRRYWYESIGDWQREQNVAAVLAALES